MKTTYKKPEISIIKLAMNHHLLQGSVGMGSQYSGGTILSPDFVMYDYE